MPLTLKERDRMATQGCEAIARWKPSRAAQYDLCLLLEICTGVPVGYLMDKVDLAKDSVAEGDGQPEDPHELPATQN